MKVLFLTTGTFGNISDSGLYPDLLREFVKDGHEVYIVSAHERRTGSPTELLHEDSVRHLIVKIGNITKTNFIEKGISTILIAHQYKKALHNYLDDIRFDLILYSTPPITLESVVTFIKRRDNAITYLILKDIFPQNAVDLDILKKSGLKGIIYRYFRKKEKNCIKFQTILGVCHRQMWIIY